MWKCTLWYAVYMCMCVFIMVHAYNFSTNRPDIYGLINILYLKADANLDATITQAELSDVFHGFDKNGNAC